MLVLNPAEHDARVCRSAGALANRGYEVRVYALGNSSWPSGVIARDGFVIERIEVQSIFVRLMAALRWCYRHAAALLLALALSAKVRRSGSWSAGGAGVTPAGKPMPFRRAVRRPATLGRWLGRWAYLAYRSVLRSLGRLVRRGYLLAYRSARKVLLPLHRPSVLLKYRREVVGRVTRWSPDVVHCHDANTLTAGVRVAAAAQALLVYDSHELWRGRNRHGQWRPIGRVADVLVERRGIGRSDAVITVSDGIAEWLERKYALADRPIVLRNVPPAWEPSPQAPLDLRAEAGLTGLDKIILYTGRITTGRGLATLLESLRMLTSDHHVVLLGYGAPDDLRRLDRQIARDGVAGRVHHVGAVAPDQVAEVASRADVVFVGIEPVCLSYRLALPNKLFEGVQAGLPVVASDLPEMRKLVLDYGLGYLFTPGDAVSAAHALTQALSNPVLPAAVRSVASTLCWEEESTDLLRLYDRLTRGLGRRAWATTTPASRHPRAGRV